MRKKIRAWWRALSVNQRLTLLVGFGSLLVGLGSLVVSVVALINATNNKEMGTAIRGLEALARETKRQADNSNEQIALLARQAEYSREQTAAISDQTTALKESSRAAIRSSNAQFEAADVTITSQRPTVRLLKVSMDLTGQPDKDGNVKFEATPVFVNMGGGLMIPKGGRFSIKFSENLPSPLSGAGYPFGGNELSIPVNGSFNPEGMTFTISKALIERFKKGELKIYVWGYVDYLDSRGSTGRFCYIDEVWQKEWGAPFLYLSAVGNATSACAA